MNENYQQQLDALLDIVYQNNASDLHLSSGRHPFIRVNGTLNPVETYPELTADDMIGLVTALAGEEKAGKLANLEEIDFAYDYGAVEGQPSKLRLRGNAYVRSNHIAVALRTIQKIRTLSRALRISIWRRLKPCGLRMISLFLTLIPPLRWKSGCVGLRV